MSKRNVYHVTYVSDQWRVRKVGATFYSSSHEKKDDAVEAAKKVAKANMPSQIVVHKMDGTFEYENTYGNDPEKTPG